MSSAQNGGIALGSAQQGMAGLSVGNGVGGAEVGPGAMVAVGKVKNVSLPAPDLSQIKSVDTHTKALGIISPPPDLRAIIDKSAAFVAKNGISFESKIMEQQKDNPRFSFLRSTDPYHKYYRWKVQQVQSGEAEGKEQAGQAGAGVAQQPVPVAPSVAPAKPLEPPQPDQYTVRTPEGLTAEHLDIMKLTAQCVARNGQAFLTGLVAREQGNPTFHFLKPTHSLFGYFKDLCDAYSRTLMPDKKLLGRLKQDAADRTGLLERCLKRLEWEKQRDAADKAASDKAEAERIAMQSIDWHDFTVVETIDFFDDEDSELPPPMTQKDVILLNRAGAFADEDAAAAATAGKADGGDEMEMDEEERAMVNQGNAGPSANGEPAATPQPPADRHAFVRTEEEDDAPMRIVKDYQRPSTRAGQGAAGMAISPITGELVPLAEMAEHMRISLIDPQWKVQREAMLSKIRETTQASDDEISRNLVDLAGHRPDVFGSTQEEVGAMVKANIDDKKISGNDRPVVWDGETRSGPDLRNQLDAVAENKAAGEKRKFPEKQQLPTPILGPAPPTSPTSLPPPPAAKAAPNSLPPPPVRAPAPLAPPPTLKPVLPAPPPVVQRPPPAMPPPQLPPPQLQPPPRMPPSPMAAAPPPRAPPPGAPPPGAPPGLPPPPADSDGPDAKRQRLDTFVLQDENEFLEQHPGSSKVRIVCPSESDNEHLNGQVLDVEVATLSTTIGDLKARLAEVLNLPPNKQQLSREHFKTMRDVDTLAYYNVLPDVELSLSVRRRGGR